MSKFFLLFGNTPALSQLEFQSLYPQAKLESCADNFFMTDFDFTANDLPLAQQIDQLAGTVKIFQLVKTLAKTLDSQTLSKEIVDFLSQKTDKICFSLQQLGKKNLDFDNQEIKAALQKRNLKARYFEESLLSTAFMAHHPQAIELLIANFPAAENLYLLQTVAVQNLDNWTRKDRQKPYANRRKGMLPPKLALMMVNSAYGQWRQLKSPAFKANQNAGQTQLAGTQSSHQPKPLLYDPFCGTATVLIEAQLRGCSVLGSDIDPEAVRGAQANLDWLKNAYQLEIPSETGKIFQADVTHLPIENFSQPVDLLVSEPFLGKQTPSEHELANVFRGLEKLYLGAFNSFARILAQQAIVCLIFPKAVLGRREYRLNLIDKLQAKGYNLLAEPVLYAREGAKIQREIYLFRFENSSHLKG